MTSLVTRKESSGGGKEKNSGHSSADTRKDLCDQLQAEIGNADEHWKETLWKTIILPVHRPHMNRADMNYLNS